MKVPMLRMELIAPITQSKQLLELLQRRGVVQIMTCQDEALVRTNLSSAQSIFAANRADVLKALEILAQEVPEKGRIELFGEKRGIGKYDFGEKASELERLMRITNAVIKEQESIRENEAELARTEAARTAMEPWRVLNQSLKLRETQSVSILLGTMPGKVEEAWLTAHLPSDCHGEIIFSNKNQSGMQVLCPKKSRTKVLLELQELGFSLLRDHEDKTPVGQIEDYATQIELLKKAIQKSHAQLAAYSESRTDLQFICDYLSMRIEKYEATARIGFTQSCFVMQGYIPERDAEKTAKELEKKFSCCISFDKPAEEEDVPVLLANNRFAAPVEGITEMYALPGKNDPDPSPIMAFFYYLFFGMMLSDAGYGLVMLIATVIILRRKHLGDKMRKTMTMFRNCGVSTLFFGALFGSWFGDAPQVIAREFFGKTIETTALWFEPLDDPIKLLLISFGLGICHLFLGIATALVMQWKHGDKLGAILDNVPVFMIVLGVAPLGTTVFMEVPAILTKIGAILMIAGVVIMVLTAGRTSKNILGKCLGGVYTLYNTATGYLSDILSYSRLLALGLATGSIAGVINLIGTMPQNFIVKLILFIVVFPIGHVANLAINLLGAYVHTDRLQFVELFSKFYEGGGTAFTPFAVHTDYIEFKEDSVS